MWVAAFVRAYRPGTTSKRFWHLDARAYCMGRGAGARGRLGR
jgi:hypothetical protein